MTNEMISVEEARDIVLDHMTKMGTQVVPLLDSVGRVCAEDVRSDIDVAPFDHSAMDGFALMASSIQDASEDSPVELRVIGEIGAGDVFDGSIGSDECIRIMTGAPVPADADSVVKYESVDNVVGDGHEGSTVAFTAPTPVGSNIRKAGEEAKAGSIVIAAGEVISEAGVGFLAGTGALEVTVHERPTIAIMATGSELVPPSEKPGPGKIRESNSHAMAACAVSAGAIPHMLPIVEDTYEALLHAVRDAVKTHDFVVTTGGAANGDYDFIKKVISDAGELLLSSVNMRPGKAQAFGIVDGTPVFGLPGNPAAAYCGFKMLIEPGLLRMQGHAQVDPLTFEAKLSVDMPKRDPRRIYLRSTLEEEPDGSFIVTPCKNQSSGLFSTLQRSNCLAILPEGTESKAAGETVECILLGGSR